LEGRQGFHHILQYAARIQALLAEATGTRATQRGSAEVPTFAEIQAIRRLQFRIDADTPALYAWGSG
jgi:hypothetical protein